MADCEAKFLLIEKIQKNCLGSQIKSGGSPGGVNIKFYLPLFKKVLLPLPDWLNYQSLANHQDHLTSSLLPKAHNVHQL